MMTMFMCKKHGMQSGVFTSPNVRDRMLAGDNVSVSELESLTLSLLTETPGVYMVDKKFFAEINPRLLNLTEESEFEIECLLVPICRACYYEHLVD